MQGIQVVQPQLAAARFAPLALQEFDGCGQLRVIHNGHVKRYTGLRDWRLRWRLAAFLRGRRFAPQEQAGRDHDWEQILQPYRFTFL